MQSFVIGVLEGLALCLGIGVAIGLLHPLMRRRKPPQRLPPWPAIKTSANLRPGQRWFVLMHCRNEVRYGYVTTTHDSGPKPSVPTVVKGAS